MSNFLILNGIWCAFWMAYASRCEGLGETGLSWRAMVLVGPALLTLWMARVWFVEGCEEAQRRNARIDAKGKR